MAGPIPLNASSGLALGGWLAASLALHVGIGGALGVATGPARASGESEHEHAAAYEIAVDVAPRVPGGAAKAMVTPATTPERASPTRERTATRTRASRASPAPPPRDEGAHAEGEPSTSALVAPGASSSSTAPAAPHASERALAEARVWSQTVAARLRAHLARHYPTFARDARIEGTVYLAIAVASDGRIGAVRVERSSGDARLDAAAVARVRALGRVTPPPAWLGTRLAPLRIPVVYRLR